MIKQALTITSSFATLINSYASDNNTSSRLSTSALIGIKFNSATDSEKQEGLKAYKAVADQLPTNKSLGMFKYMS